MIKPRLFCLWLLLSAAIGLSAYDFKYGDLYYNITSDSTVAVAESSKNTDNYRGLSSVSIPTSVIYNERNYTVTSIGKSAFAGSSLTSVAIPSSIISIEWKAFYYCFNLTSITSPYPNGLKEISNNAFDGTSWSENQPDGVIYIGSFLYVYKGDMPQGTTIIIEEGTTAINSRAFSAFSDCSGLTSITIPNSVTSIGSSAFSGCSGLTSITIPNSVTSIGSSAFSGCSGLTSITIPNSVTSIGSSAFSGCSGLTSITIPNSVTSIGSSAFSGCSGLTSITIPNSVTSIGDEAFSGCSGLTYITIPNSVTSIGDEAFHYCRKAVFTFISDTPPQCGSNSFVGTRGKFIIPCWSEEKYRAALGDYDFVEPQSDYQLSVQSIDFNGGYASVKNKPNCRDNIGIIKATNNHGYHFTQWNDGNTDNPRTITLTRDTTLTAEFAIDLFGQCGNALYWQYDNHTLTISGTGSMYNYSTDDLPWLLFCDTTEAVVVESGCTHIGDNAFYGLSSITKIELPGTITSIGESAFANCSKLSSVYLPAMLNTIGANAFAGCRKLGV